MTGRAHVDVLLYCYPGSQNRSAEVDKIRMSGLREKVDQVRLFYMMELAEELTKQAHTINQMKAHFKNLKIQLKHSFDALSVAAADPLVCSICATRMSSKAVTSMHVVTSEASAASPSASQTVTPSRSVMTRVRSANTVNRLAEVDAWLEDDQPLDIDYDDGTQFRGWLLTTSRVFLDLICMAVVCAF